MKKITILILILFTFHACNSSIKINKDQNRSILKKAITIDVDEELLLQKSIGELRNDSSNVLETPIYIGDNDEVSFKGDTLEKNSPLTITIGENKAITFKGNNYTIRSMELKNGDIIQMKDKNGNTFLEMEVIKP